MSEQICSVGGVELCYETFGDPADPAVLLVMGLGFQMVAWPEEFCEGFVERGFHVIRFDNRDCGRSTHLSDWAPPTLAQLATRRIRRPAYTLEDMASDAAGLLDHLGIERAHVVGVSMGGMIAQALAAQSPERVLSLVSVMANTGSRFNGQPSVRLWPYLLTQPPADRERYIEHVVKLSGLIGSPGYQADEAVLRDMLGLTFDRGQSPDGFARQLGAIFASGRRVRALRRISAPTLVVHGMADRLVSPSGGRATARAIPGAHLLLLDGMGHDLPRELWPLLTDAIVSNAARRAARAAQPPSRRAQ